MANRGYDVVVDIDAEVWVLAPPFHRALETKALL